MSTPGLDVEVRELLEKRRGDWPRIAKGGGVSHSWISQFVRQKIPNPGYATLRALWRYMVEGVEAAPETAPESAPGELDGAKVGV